MGNITLNDVYVVLILKQKHLSSLRSDRKSKDLYSGKIILHIVLILFYLRVCSVVSRTPASVLTIGFLFLSSVTEM